MAKKNRYYDSMISADSGAQANMPQSSFTKMYPESYSYLPESLNDGLSGVDKQMGYDNAKRTGDLKPKKV